ncbi:putative carboxypeptidase Y inhibitor [Hyaloscypha hepaticicola]|uniref:Putative carboxypeptidase Y inhibitor n=1 Tax=Hyaloscypha hepaticicola TaxID=2082293 RepID=A0A2J6QJR6_9HELO|nr:putative carboxypeptidase Y inhibitor [Hyaloscypha hepaticicola]
MWIKIPEVLLFLLLASHCRGLASPENQKVIGNSQSGFDGIRKALKKASIIDEVIDDFEGKCFVVPLYGKKERPVALGNVFKEAKTKGKPALRIYCPHMQSTPGLTIALTDPDAPSRDDPKWSEMCHWISIIPISNQDGVQIDLEGRTEEKDLVEYKPPGPPGKTGYHRYVFLLLEGDNSNLTAPEDRQHWGTGKKRHGVRDWAKQEGLEVIGANYFIEKNKKQ